MHPEIGAVLRDRIVRHLERSAQIDDGEDTGQRLAQGNRVARRHGREPHAELLRQLRGLARALQAQDAFDFWNMRQRDADAPGELAGLSQNEYFSFLHRAGACGSDRLPCCLIGARL